MSTLANRQNNSALMSESDNDDDFDQNLSTNQQNESMMHKVKDVVSKFLHPSFLFSAAGETSRSKRKRTISVEDQGEEKQLEVNSQPIATINGHGISSKLKDQRKTKIDDEAQLTDDETSTTPEVPSIGKDLIDAEQQKKRRRTANYQQFLTSTTSNTTNGAHQHDRISPLSNTTNSVEFSSSHRLLDDESNTTPVLVQRSTEITENEGRHRLSITKQRINIPSTNRSFSSNYDPSQSPLFSVGNRKTTETTMSSSRTTTNLKSNTNEFSGNYLLASGLAQRAQTNPVTQANQSISTLSNPNPNLSQRLLSTERQMLGINYASINSRRLPYIERLRRRTLQDCIRLNRTLDSEPLSISTIEEHTSTTASPRRNPIKAPEKDCGIQCNISTTDSLAEPNRKIQRTFPPADIRDEALSIPLAEKASNVNLMVSSIQTQSSITIEPAKSTAPDITKPKVLANITTLSWPKFARAQEEYAKKYPEKCRADNIPTAANASLNQINVAPPMNNTINSTTPKIPLFNASPPRPNKSVAGPVWKCPSCTIEHPAQTASCSMCHGINPNYKRLSAMDSTAPSKLPDVIVEAPVVFTSKTTTVATTPVATTIATSPITTTTLFPTISMPTTTQNITFSVPTATATLPLTTTASGFPSFVATASIPTSASIPATTKESSAINPSVLGTAPTAVTFSATTPSLFGTAAAPTTTANSFSFGANSSSTFPSFGSFSSSTSTTSSTTTASSMFSTASTTTASSMFSTATTTTASSTPTVSPAVNFGSSSNVPSITAVTTTSLVPADKAPMFSFGVSASAPSLTSLVSSSLMSAAATTTSASFSPGLFSFEANSTKAAVTSASSTLPATVSTGGFSFSSGFPLVSASTAAITTTTNSTASNTPLLFGSAPATSSAGFSFHTPVGAASLTTTTTSNSTSFAFGASNPPRPFAPSVVSSSFTPTVPGFGSTSTFGAATSTTATSFSGFGSSNTSGLFTFGASSNATVSNPPQSLAAPAGTTSGFAFSAASSPSSTAATGSSVPAFGSTSSSFNFNAGPSTSFGIGGTGSTGTSSFGFGGLPPSGGSNSLAVPPSNDTADNNPFSVTQDSGGQKRQVIKAKRRAVKP